jgi:putative intracellular protease/amidase
VEQFGGIWGDDEPVVVDGNLISSRHPDDVRQFASAICEWLLASAKDLRKRARTLKGGSR